VNFESCSSFSVIISTNFIEIDDPVEIIERGNFNLDQLLKEVIFSSSNHLRDISGFQLCISLCRIKIPSSVEPI
jgi:hypothetical protein